MKKYITFALMAIISFTIVSCSSDDNGVSISDNQLVGLWELTKMESYIEYKGKRQQVDEEFEHIREQFNSDHTYIEYEYNSYTKQWERSSDHKTTWTLAGNKLKLIIDRDEVITATITTFTKNTLELTVTEKEGAVIYEEHMTFKKIE